VPVLSEPDAARSGRAGVVHEAMLADFPDLSAFEDYMSGPPAMAHAARQSFLAASATEDHLHDDSFDFAPDVPSGHAVGAILGSRCPIRQRLDRLARFAIRKSFLRGRGLP
jgi:CDP-4-dehydro-6-deoxyglucose reductase